MSIFYLDYWIELFKTTTCFKCFICYFHARFNDFYDLG